MRHLEIFPMLLGIYKYDEYGKQHRPNWTVRFRSKLIGVVRRIHKNERRRLGTESPISSRPSDVKAMRRKHLAKPVELLDFAIEKIEGGSPAVRARRQAQ